MTDADRPMDAAAHCLDLVRQHDKDRYLAILFAPAETQPALAALAAFEIEIARVREVVREPMPGEIRLQWWRDVIDADAVSGHPVADTLVAAIARYHLPKPALIALIDAHGFDLYDDPMPSLTDLEGYAGETAGALFQLAAIVLAGGNDPGTGSRAGHAGVAFTIARMLQALPLASSRGQVFLPADVLARHGADVADIRAGRMTPGLAAALKEMRGHAEHHLARVGDIASSIPSAVVPAFLPLAGLPSLLKRLARSKDDPLHTQTETPALARIWRMWWIARRARRRA
ncbi:phytoene synthase [Pseudoxanthobacter soli DSM 19599]|uniref:Phytoene synthase n=2 Tax=Pseudoxanthobacter TaxID=433838 RepID=A0A1M7ZM61_9HYPH|nr:phytoene synthase [Pseudoxanthobacter soli DSM 19599]